MECNQTSSNGNKYIITDINYFTKWVEAMPTFNSNTIIAVYFFFNHVISQFVFPKNLVCNYDQHFADEFWCEIALFLGF